MSDTEIKPKKNGNNGNGSQPSVDPKILEAYLKDKNKNDVPNPFNVLFTQETEDDLNKTTRINGREAVFFSVNAVRDDALIPPRTRRNPKGRPSVSTCLRMHLKGLKISEGGKGRDDVKEVNQLSQEEAEAQNGSRLDL